MINIKTIDVIGSDESLCKLVQKFKDDLIGEPRDNTKRYNGSEPTFFPNDGYVEYTMLGTIDIDSGQKYWVR
jgi:hypothetical protein